MFSNFLKSVGLAFCLMTGLFGAQIAVAGPAGTIVKIQGDAFIAPQEGTSRAARAEDNVNEGDLISTGKGSEILIRFNDQSVMTLRPETSVLIKQFRHEESAVGSFVANLLKGALRSVSGLIGKANPRQVRFQTPTATIGIRGTDFELAILEEDTSDARAGTYNYVNDGLTTIALANNAEEGQSLEVKPEQTGLALAHPRPGEPALQLLKQRPAFLRGGGFDAHMMQISAQPIRAIQIMPRR